MSTQCVSFWLCVSSFDKQARKGFRPPSAMYGIGYFQNLRNFLRNCLEIVWTFFGQIFWEDLFGRNSLFTLSNSAKLFEYTVFYSANYIHFNS